MALCLERSVDPASGAVKKISLGAYIRREEYNATARSQIRELYKRTGVYACLTTFGVCNPDILKDAGHVPGTIDNAGYISNYCTDYIFSSEISLGYSSYTADEEMFHSMKQNLSNLLLYSDFISSIEANRLALYDVLKGCMAEDIIPNIQEVVQKANECYQYQRQKQQQAQRSR